MGSIIKNAEDFLSNNEGGFVMKHKKMFRMIIIGMIIWGILWASVCNDSINVTNAATSSVDVEIQSKQNCNIIQEKKEKKKKRIMKKKIMERHGIRK